MHQRRAAAGRFPCRTEPQVLNFGRLGTGLKLREGMVFTIEPMINQGTRNVSTASDG
jgi:methionyl aminopeptidase